MFVVLSWAPNLGVDLARWPHVGEFGRRVQARAAVQAAVAAERLQKAA
jgi:glutathione S-transferase